MPRVTTAGRIELEEALPLEVRHLVGVLDKKGLARLAEGLAPLGPDAYRTAMKRLSDVAARVGYESGGYSFGPEHMDPGPETAKLRAAFDQRVKGILADPSLSPRARDAELVKASLEHMDPLQAAVSAESRAAGNPIALQVESGAKGKAENLRALIAGDVLYTDAKHEPVPVPVRHSFAEGLRPAEFFGGAYGARIGIATTKLGTASGGYLAKRASAVTHRLVVTSPDGPEPHPDASPIGYPVETADSDNEGALLAHPAGGYPRNTHLTRDVLGDLRRRGIDKLLIRSPAVGGPGDGGLYGADAGVRERGTVSPVGESVGIASSQALTEPLTQLIIGCLTEGTLVRMGNGTVKPVERIQPGEYVLGASRRGRTTPVRVTKAFVSGLKPCIRTTFTRPDHDPVEMESTAAHRVLSQTWTRVPVPGAARRPPRRREVGHRAVRFHAAVASPDGAAVCWFRRTTQEPIGDRRTYDIEVDNAAHLFVLANGLIVSNSKHGGGVAGASKGQQGFPALDRLTAAPQHYPGGATHAKQDGLVTAIRDAPQGGKEIVVDGETHYAPPDLAPVVAQGDKVEAGDPLTEGVQNPAEITRHKGIGEARKRFVDEFMRVSHASGFRPHRRNLEVLARGLIDHVTVHAETGEFAPGETVPYHAVAAEYTPRPGHARVAPAAAVGQYLERPAAHLTVGTRVQPSHLPLFATHGIDRVTVHPDPPPFSPVFVRSHDALAYDRDWLTQMLGSGLEKNLLKSVARGAVSDPTGTSYVPATAEGVRLSQPGTKTKGWVVPPAPTPPPPAL